MKRTLVAAGWYNLVWGAVVILFPGWLFQLAGMELPRYPQIWQCVGMIVGVYGVGYLAAARDPFRHWPVVLVGFLGKIFGPIGFLFAALQGELPWAWGATILTNDLIWWVPFGWILYESFRVNTDRSLSVPPLDWSEAMGGVTSHRGATLGELSAQRPLLVVFVRHAGCTFCREMLADLADQRQRLEAEGCRLAIVSMSDPLSATQLAGRYGLEDVHRFSDPDCRLYRAFGLRRGNFGQLFGPKVVGRGLAVALLRGHGLGSLQGDGFQMAGVFLLKNGQIARQLPLETAAERADYQSLLCDPCPSTLEERTCSSSTGSKPYPLPVDLRIGAPR